MMLYTQIDTIPEDYIRNKVNEFLTEDFPNGDVTTDYLPPREISAEVQAQEDFVLAGSITTKLFFPNCRIELFHNDSDMVRENQIIAKIHGNAGIILRSERAYLNLLQRMSGIATQTKKYTEKAELYGVKILDTRKTTPGLRLFEKYSVRQGGGYNHRLDLSSGILIKDNHIQAAGSITNAIKILRTKGSNLPLEIEVENQEQIQEALENDVTAFLLDNMSREETIISVNMIRKKLGNNCFIESSGGMNLRNFEKYLDTGIDAISIGGLTHSVKSSDIHIEFE